MTIKTEYLRLKFSQMMRTDRYAENGKILTGRSLQAARKRILHEMVSLRGGAAPTDEARGADRNAMSWSNTANLFRMRRRIAPTSLQDFLRDCLLAPAASPADRKTTAARCVRTQFPHLLGSDDLRVATLHPRNVEAMRRAAAARPLSLAEDAEGHARGAPVVMDRAGYYRVIDDCFGPRVPASSVSRKPPSAPAERFGASLSVA